MEYFINNSLLFFLLLFYNLLLFFVSLMDSLEMKITII